MSDPQEWLAGYQSPPPDDMLPEPVNVPGSVQRHDPEPEGLDLGPSGAAEDAWSEAKRVAENERFKIWEAGFTAGLQAANGGLPQNPYQWHGAGYVPVGSDAGTRYEEHGVGHYGKSNY